MTRSQDIPYGFCHCGCGSKTTVAEYDAPNGVVAGEPRRFIRGHASRKGRGATPADRFWSRVNRGEDAECWEWLGGVDRGGYGQADWDGRHTNSHRVAYELVSGPVPAGLVLDHLCRNRVCCNPSHMEPVTYAENSRRGSSTKLTIDQVREIRSLEGQFSRADIAKRFGVWHTTIARILDGKSWRGEF